MSHYTVGYHDQQRHHFEICEYADNTFDAIQHAKEDVPFLKNHPQYIDCLLYTSPSPRDGLLSRMPSSA